MRERSHVVILFLKNYSSAQSTKRRTTTHLNVSSSTIVLLWRNYMKRKTMREHFRIVISFWLL
jgi:hypothetical protein